jgi:hypothetical protein
VNEFKKDFDPSQEVKQNLILLYQNEKSCKKCRKAYDCVYTGTEDYSIRQHIDKKTKDYLRKLKERYNTFILTELKSPSCANFNILNSKREEIFEGCMKVLLEIQQQSSISTPYMPYYLPVSNLLSHTSPIHVSIPPRSPIHVSMPPRSPTPVSMSYFYPRMTQLPPPTRQPQTYDPEFLSFLSPENRNSLRSNPQKTLKRILTVNTKNVFNEGVKKRRKTKKLKRQSNR